MVIKTLTLHSKRRIKSRCKISDPKKQIKFVNDAIKYGTKVTDISDDRIREYLCDHAVDSICYVYEDWVFIIGKNNKKLITVYEIPTKLKGNNNND